MWLSFRYKFFSLFFPRLINSKMKVDALKRVGVKIGKGTVFFDAGNITVDASRPELLSIGEYCKITGGTIILTHDYSRSVLRRVYGDILGEARCTDIGNNVFVGVNTIILMGTKIGDNSIIGAGSICHGEYPANSVIVGNPARVIMSLDDYYKKRKSVYSDEGRILVEAHLARFGKIPSIHEMGAFFPLYLERNIELLQKNKLRTNLSGDVEEEVIADFMKSKPLYNSYDEFLKSNSIGEEL